MSTAVHVLKWVGIGAAIWVVVSIPSALIIGRVLRRNRLRLEALEAHQPRLRLVSEERYDQQALRRGEDAS